MQAIVHHGPNGLDGLKVEEMKEGVPNPDEVKVRLKSSGLNHRDLRVLSWREKETGPVILGSDGAGIVEETGERVGNVQPGDEIVINPSLGWPCRSEAPPVGFQILGYPSPGTFASSIVVPAENVEPKPKHLTWAEAGVLPLAALTGYRALFSRGKVQAGEHVLIPGIGSGVATFMLLMAKAAGARVTVTSRWEEKRNNALELGADEAIDSDTDWNEELKGKKVDLIIDSVGPATFHKSLQQLRPGGRWVNFGETSGSSVEVPLRTLFMGQFDFHGTAMGSNEEFRDMLRLVNQHQIRPVIDRVFPLSEAKQAFMRMKDGRQFGKIGFENE